MLLTVACLNPESCIECPDNSNHPIPAGYCCLSNARASSECAAVPIRRPDAGSIAGNEWRGIQMTRMHMGICVLEDTFS